MNKRLVQINVVCNGSTGRIMNQIQQKAIENGWEAYSFYGRGNPTNENCFKIGNNLDVLFHVFLTRFWDKHGHGSKRATHKLIKKIEEINPDVIQLHNIHGYYLNIEVLFEYLKRSNKKIIWTLHDCWAFTGHCTHFTYPKCEKWKIGCSECKRKKEYPSSILKDNSATEYKQKMKLFNNIKNLTIVTPSKWLGDLVQRSFLKEYKVKVINNGIDTNVFKPISTIDIRKKYNIEKNKKIILGVAAIWDERKGLEDFVNLSQMIPDEYIMLIIGLNEKQIRKLPSNIIGIKRTENIEELVNIYSTADVLFNPSKEESFSLVTVEAMACEIPVIAYDNSAIKELINEENGYLLDVHDEDRFKKILEYLKQMDINKNKINVSQYNIENMTEKYIKLYEEKYK